MALGIRGLGADAHGGDASEVGVNGAIYGALLHGLIVIGQVLCSEGDLGACIGGADGDRDVVGAVGLEVKRAEDGVAVFETRSFAIEEEDERLRFITALFSGDSEAPSGAAFFPAGDNGTDLLIGIDAVEEDVCLDGEAFVQTEF